MRLRFFRRHMCEQRLHFLTNYNDDVLCRLMRVHDHRPYEENAYYAKNNVFDRTSRSLGQGVICIRLPVGAVVKTLVEIIRLSSREKRRREDRRLSANLKLIFASLTRRKERVSRNRIWIFNTRRKEKLNRSRGSINSLAVSRREINGWRRRGLKFLFHWSFRPVSAKC